MNKYIIGSAVVVTLLAVFVRPGASILCWKCNSALDPRCGEFNFDRHTLDQVDCSQLERNHIATEDAQFCRKIVQNIEGKVRTIRGCGWVDDDKYPVGDCFTRTGTKDIMVTYCHCDKDGCNPASTIVASMSLAVMLVVFTILF